MDNKKHKCKVSTGIHGGITFGRGKLDQFGYWEKPCRECAIKFDQKKDQRIKELMEDHPNKTLKQIEEDHEWAFLPAWPYENKFNH